MTELTPDTGDAPETIESIWVDIMADEDREDKFETLRKIVHERDRLAAEVAILRGGK